MKHQNNLIILTSCPVTNCKNEAVIQMFFGIKSAFPCEYHQELRSHNDLPTKQHEFTSDSIRDGRKSHARSVLQPWRHHEPSREFIEAWPEDAKKAFTPKEIKNAKNVWSDISSYRDWKTSR